MRQREHKTLVDMLEAYSLGVLEEEERKRVERHLRTNCKECLTIVDDYTSIVAGMGLSSSSYQPPDTLKKRILTGLNRQETGSNKTEPDQYVLKHSAEGWVEKFPGIFVKSLYQDPVTRHTTMLVRLKPGSVLPRHIHHGTEESYVIEGSCVLSGVQYSEGDYMHVASGHVHEELVTKKGCLLFVRLPEIEFYV